MYRTDFWTLWEKARVGCFERTACILSIHHFNVHFLLYFFTNDFLLAVHFIFILD